MQKFELGRVVATPGALETLNRLNVNPLTLSGRHVSGDYGDLDDDATGRRTFKRFKPVLGCSQRMSSVTTNCGSSLKRIEARPVSCCPTSTRDGGRRGRGS